MSELDTRKSVEGVVLVPFDPRPLPATLLAYAEQIRAVQERSREGEKDDGIPEL